MRKTIYFLLVILCFSFATDKLVKTKPVVFNQTQKERLTDYIAGSNICLDFDAQKDNQSTLVIKNVFGTSLANKKYANGNLQFCIPHVFTTKAGKLHWQLINRGQIRAKGFISIIPDTAKTYMESYFGPRQISAGDIDFSMLANIPTDKFDNTLKNDVLVTVKSEFENTITTYQVPVKKSIAWKNIPATKKSGRILVSSLCNGAFSKQLTTIVYPALASDFEVSYKRDHTFADGNQIMELQTNQILDQYGNVVSDGTHVNFLIKEKNGSLLHSSGNTLNGRAIAKMLHPEEPVTWSFEAFVTGAARSNTVLVDFKPAFKDYEIKYLRQERKLIVGPLLGFIDQQATDGFSVNVHIKSEENLVNLKEILYTKNGKATLILEKEFFPTGAYNITITTAGITKKMNIKLFDETK